MITVKRIGQVECDHNDRPEDDVRIVKGFVMMQCGGGEGNYLFVPAVLYFVVYCCELVSKKILVSEK